MTASADTYGFPAGYFIIRSAANKRLFDVDQDEVEDGTEIVLWPEKEGSLVENLRLPEANNQVFFVDTSGALCSRSSGHAIDIEDDRLVLRHRRPVSYPFPNPYSHPLPKFSYNSETGEISVVFSANPDYPTPGSNSSTSDAWRLKSFILASIPMRRPRTIIDDASAFLSSAISTPLSLFSGGLGSPPKATPEEVFNGDIDLNEDEVLEEDRGEDMEVDDSPESIRKVRVLAVSAGLKKEALGEKARQRRQWQVVSLRKSVAPRMSI